MDANAQDLTGIWQGLYTYADGRSVSFVATLIESGGALTGTTHEPCVSGRAAGGTLFATLAGTRQGDTVSFRKTYEGDVPGYGAVDYVGMLNSDASEIEGRWIILGVWSGKFLMIRPIRASTSTENEVAARP